MSDNDDTTVPLDSVKTGGPASETDALPRPAEAPASTWTPTTTATATSTTTVPRHPPRTRWAAIVWGLIIAGIAATTLAIVGSPERRLALSDWASTLTPGAFWVLSALVLGVLILILAVLALIRRAQRARREA